MRITIIYLIFIFPIFLFSQNKSDTLQVNDPFLFDSWTIIQGKENNKPIIIRLNSGFLNFENKSNFPYKSIFSLKFKNKDSDGLPAPEENFYLYSIEDSLYHYLVDTKLALPVLIISTNGKREFIFYTKDKKAIEQNLSFIKSKVETYSIEYNVEYDKKWSIYNKYSNLNK